VLAWAAKALGYDLSQASYLQGVVAVGIAFGAVLAARFVSLRRAVNVLPIGTAMGLVVITMIFVTTLPVAIVLMILIGGCAGFFVVPMNALLQHRGHVLMGAGHSIAVQNFNENIGILVMVGLYAVMIQQGISVNRAVVLFGLFMSSAMLLVMWRHQYNQSKGDSLHLIAEDGDHRHSLQSTTGASEISLRPGPVRGECCASSAEISTIPCSAPSANRPSRQAASILRQIDCHAASPTRA